MKRNLSLLIILLFISCNQLKKETSIFNFSLENLSKIDSYSSKLVENNELPGIVVMVKRGDKLVYHKAFGYSDIEKKIEIDKNIILAHSHQQYIRYINNFLLLNPGSLGQNRKFINMSNYIIWDTETCEFELKYLHFSIDLLINEMKSKNFPQICVN